MARVGNYDLVVGARSPSTQATIGRRLGNALLNRLATRLTQYPVKDLTSGFRAARTAQLRQFLHMLPNGFSAPTTIISAYIRGGYRVAFEPIDARTRTGRRSTGDQNAKLGEVVARADLFKDPPGRSRWPSVITLHGPSHQDAAGRQ